MTQFLDLLKFISDHEATFNNYLEDQANPKYTDLKGKLQTEVHAAIEKLEEAAALNDSNSNMHFYIGVLRTISGSASEAVQNFANAIEKSDDNYYTHYFWKGIALSEAGCFDLALSELEIAKNIEKNNVEVSLHIGVCFLIVGDLDNAYEAFKAVVGCPKNEMEVNFCIGKFFMSRGFMAHAIQSFQFALKNFTTEKVLQELLKCFVHEKNLVSAMDTLAKLESLNNKAKLQYSFDMAVLQSLKQCCEERLAEALDLLTSLDLSKKEGFIFKRKDLLLYIAFVNFLSSDYQKALKSFTLLEMDHYSKERDKNSLIPSEEEDAFGIIFLDSIEREGQFYVSSKSITRPELIYNIGICHLMLKNLDKAYLKFASLLTIPQISLKVHKLMSRLKRYVTVETLSKAKTLSGKFQPNQSHLSEEEEDLANEMLLDSSEKIADPSETCPMPTENRLCSIYPTSRLDLAPGDSIELRLSFCLPEIKLSEIKIEVGYEELLKLNLRSIEFKPEAPWIKKLDERIIFTNHVVEDEVAEYNSPADLLEKLRAKKDLPINTRVKLNIEHAYQHHLEVQRAALLKPNTEGEHDESMDEHDFDEDEDEEIMEKPDLKKLKRELMLDDRTNEVLSKLKK